MNATSHLKLTRAARPLSERRRHRRHTLAGTRVLVEVVADDGSITARGEIVDLSAGGVRVRTEDVSIAPGETVNVRLSLPEHAGIRPFSAGGEPTPSCEWAGKLSVLRRIERGPGRFELGGRLLDMGDLDRGMLGLYLSIQPLAA